MTTNTSATTVWPDAAIAKQMLGAEVGHGGKVRHAGRPAHWRRLRARGGSVRSGARVRVAVQSKKRPLPPRSRMNFWQCKDPLACRDLTRTASTRGLAAWAVDEIVARGPGVSALFTTGACVGGSWPGRGRPSGLSPGVRASAYRRSRGCGGAWGPSGANALRHCPEKPMSTGANWPR